MGYSQSSREVLLSCWPFWYLGGSSHCTLKQEPKQKARQSLQQNIFSSLDTTCWCDYLIGSCAPLNSWLIKVEVKPVHMTDQNKFKWSFRGVLPVDKVVLCRNVGTLEIKHFSLWCGDVHFVQVCQQLQPSYVERSYAQQKIHLQLSKLLQTILILMDKMMITFFLFTSLGLMCFGEEQVELLFPGGLSLLGQERRLWRAWAAA